jgi:HAD superfamily hydrolase (TIGR01509 family)
MTAATLPYPAAVILDLDGTLVDTVPARIEAWLDALGRAGIQASRASVGRRIGMDGQLLAGELAALAGMSVDESSLAVIDRQAGEAFARLNAAPRPLPGAAELLEALDRNDIPWAIATSSRREQVGTSVAALRLDAPLTIVDGETVRTAKPAPDLLLAAAGALRVDARDCWSIGDSIWDIQAAKSAGMAAIVVAAGSALTCRRLAVAGADATVDALVGVMPLIGAARLRAG